MPRPEQLATWCVDARADLTVRASLLAVMTVGHPPTGSPNERLELAGWNVLIADAQ